MTTRSLQSLRTTERRAALLAVLATVAWGTSVPAQEMPPLRAGARIRLVSPLVPVGEVEGRLVFVSADSLSMVAEGVGRVVLPMDQVGQMYVNRGRNPAYFWGSVAVGAVSGALLGPVILTEDERCKLGFDDVADCVKETSDPVIGATVGAVVFGLLSQFVFRDRWVRVPLERIVLDLRRGVHDTYVVAVVVRF